MVHEADDPHGDEAAEGPKPPPLPPEKGAQSAPGEADEAGPPRLESFAVPPPAGVARPAAPRGPPPLPTHGPGGARRTSWRTWAALALGVIGFSGLMGYAYLQWRSEGDRHYPERVADAFIDALQYGQSKPPEDPEECGYYVAWTMFSPKLQAELPYRLFMRQRLRDEREFGRPLLIDASGHQATRIPSGVSTRRRVFYGEPGSSRDQWVALVWRLDVVLIDGELRIARCACEPLDESFRR